MAHLDEGTALAFRSDDAEIAALEEKLGLASSSKSKKKLNKEFASTFMGYGEDFGDFLDDLDQLGEKVGTGSRAGRSLEDDESMDSDSSEVPHNGNEESSNSGSESDEDFPEDTADHDVSLTYQPTSGEDIYGNITDDPKTDSAKPT